MSRAFKDSKNWELEAELIARSSLPLMEMLAPVVMGAVGRTQQQNGLDSSGLADYLGQQQQEQAAATPGLMGTLSSMLDSNKDGSVTDDLSRIAGSFFK